MENEIWIKHYAKPELHKPLAVVGSPGLRSIGKLVVESLISETKAEIMADLYSKHLPSIYETQPSYAAHPALPGFGGAIIESGKVDLPKVQFYASATPPLVIVKGYHANFEGQFNVGKKVVEFLNDMKVKRVIVVAGFGSKEKKICCAASSQEIIQEMKTKFNVNIGYKGPFMGFSGLVFGLTKLYGIEAMCLFSSTEPKEEDLESPDNESAQRALAKLMSIIKSGESPNEQPNSTV